MATEAAMVSVDSPDSDSESEESYENMEGMFMAERIRVLPCRVGAQLLVSVKYVRNKSSIVEVRVVRVRVESVHAMYTHADQIVRYNHNYERHNHFNLVLRLSKSTKSALFIEQETDRNVPVEANYHPTFGPADEMETDAVAGCGWVLGQGEANVTGGISLQECVLRTFTRAERLNVSFPLETATFSAI